MFRILLNRIDLIRAPFLVTLALGCLTFNGSLAWARNGECQADLTHPEPVHVGYSEDGAFLYDIRANISHGAGAILSKRLGADTVAVRGTIEVMLELSRHEHGPLSATVANEHLKLDLDLPAGLPSHAHLKRTHEQFAASESLEVHRVEVDVQGSIIYVFNAHARGVQRGPDLMVADLMSHDIALKIDVSADHPVIESHMGRLKIFVGDTRVADAVQILNVSKRILRHFYPNEPQFLLKTYRGETLELNGATTEP